MQSNGTGMTEQELMALPEVNAALWQDGDGPTSMTDSQGRLWMVGRYQGRLCRGGYGRTLNIPSAQEEPMDDPTQDEADHRRGHKLYRSTGEVSIRCNIPIQQRRNLKAIQLKEAEVNGRDLTIGEAVAWVCEQYFGEHPVW